MCNHTSKEFPMRLDATRMGEFQRCPRYYWLANIANWQPKQLATPLNFGQVMHKSLEVFYKSGSEEVAIQAWKDYSPPDGEDLRTQGKGIVITKSYINKYKNDILEFLEVEKNFQTKVGENDFFGRIDAVVKWHNSLWVMDRKTTSSLGRSFLDKFRPNNQVYGYIYAERTTRPSVSGFLVDAILVSKTKIDFQRCSVTPIPSEIEMFIKSFTETCSCIKQCEAKGVWNQHFNNCHMYFTKCQYYPICLYGDYHEFEQRERIF